MTINFLSSFVLFFFCISKLAMFTLINFMSIERGSLAVDFCFLKPTITPFLLKMPFLSEYSLLFGLS